MTRNITKFLFVTNCRDQATDHAAHETSAHVQCHRSESCSFSETAHQSSCHTISCCSCGISGTNHRHHHTDSCSAATAGSCSRSGVCPGSPVSRSGRSETGDCSASQGRSVPLGHRIKNISQLKIISGQIVRQGGQTSLIVSQQPRQGLSVQQRPGQLISAGGGAVVRGVTRPAAPGQIVMAAGKTECMRS